MHTDRPAQFIHLLRLLAWNVVDFTGAPAHLEKCTHGLFTGSSLPRWLITTQMLRRQGHCYNWTQMTALDE